MILFVRIISSILFKMYGYEGLNLLFRVLPSSHIIRVLKRHGATIGNNVRIQNPVTIHNADRDTPTFKNLTIGDDVYIGRHCFFDLADKITIESRVTISHYCIINTHTDAGNSPLSGTKIPVSKGAVTLKEGAYIGINVTILQEVEIGKMTTIGACSLVNKSVGDHVVAYGTPAKIKSGV